MQSTPRGRPRWHWVLAIIWLIFALIGTINLIERASSYFHVQLPSMDTAALVVGPGFATGIPLPSENSPATSTPMTVIPAVLKIPSIGVDAKVEHVGLKSDGSVDTPSSFSTVAWYQNGPQPGEPGNAIIDGHVNNALTSAGVFEHLDQLHLGDTIEVSDASGNTLTYSVNSEQLYSADNAPTAEIFATSGPSQLILITCDGAWDQGKKEFNERLIVYASLQS